MPVRLALLLLAALPCFAAYPNGYSYRRELTIDQTKLTGDVSNFPVLVSGTYSYLATVANGGLVTDAQGDDVVFTSSDGTTALKHEVEVYTAASGLVVYWVKLPSISSSVATVFYIYYGNAAVTTDQSDKVNVWDANFKAVWHFPDGTTLAALDSTSGDNDGTLVNTPTSSAGKADGAANFASASTQYVETANNTNLALAAITYTSWVKAASFPAAYNAVMGRHNGNATYAQAFVTSTGKIAFYCTEANYDGTGIATLSTGTWYHIAITYSSTDGLRGYVNGIEDDTAAAGGALSTVDSAVFRIGSDSNTASREWNGDIDDPRVSDVVRSSHWFIAEYNSTNSPSTFYAMGSQEVSGRRRIVILN